MTALQLALDRMTVAGAVRVAERAAPYVDWMEVGTSLVKEFGMEGVRELRRSFPEKRIVADMKTMDNARYEFALCYEAGADVATVMGVAPDVTVEACLATAREYGREVMIDLLNASPARVAELARHGEAILCAHLSKDEQESSGGGAAAGHLLPAGHQPRPRLAIAGGVTPLTLRRLAPPWPDVLIVGGAITAAPDPAAAARELREIVSTWKEGAAA